jgi:glycosyltransferase involved in cell wall biosynthesis
VNPRTQNARPKILEVLYSFGFGGSEIVGLQLAKELADSGVEVLCAAIDSTPGPLQEKCTEYGIRTVNLNIPSDILGRNGISVALTRRLRSLHLDAIHLHHFLGLNKLGLPARLAGIKRVVVTEHSVLDVSQSRAGRVRARVSWRLASRITVIHQSIKDYLCKELGLPDDLLEVLPIGLQLDEYDRRDRVACRQALGFGSQITFVFVGRLAPVKNVPGLIAAFLAVQSRHSTDSRLIVVGAGEDRGTCQDLVSSHELGYRVKLVGAQGDPRPYLAAADVFVLNSRSEGTPRALLEAMAMGLPGICPAVGGIPDLLNGRGWLTAPGDQSSLEASIEFVLHHPDAISQLSEPCRQYVKSNFDSRRITERYRELLAGRPP